MTKATENILELAGLLDKEKSRIGNIDKRKAIEFLNKDDVSIFPLYYSFFSLVREKENIELETIDIIVKHKENANRIKAIYSSLFADVAWSSVPAFIVCLQAINNDTIDVDSAVPYEPEDIIWGLINMMGIDGAELLPTTTEVNRYIVSSLVYYDNYIVPLSLRFKKLLDIAGDTHVFSKKLQDISVRELSELSNVNEFKGISPSDLNTLLENTEIATILIKKFNKLISEWKYLVE
jgi:hypothetical protein